MKRAKKEKNKSIMTLLYFYIHQVFFEEYINFTLDLLLSAAIFYIIACI